MNTTELVANVILSMRQYQKENGIEKQCITNTQYLYDFIMTNSTSDVKVKAVLVIGEREEGVLCLVSGHLVVILDDELVIDPSYDVSSLKNRRYFDNVNDFLKCISDVDRTKFPVDVKTIIESQLKFMKYAKKMNNGDCLVVDEDFYNKQADYIVEKYSLIKDNLKSPPPSPPPPPTSTQNSLI